jgi:hypothetical protein
MILGLFPKADREVIISMIVDCFTLLTDENIESALYTTSKLHTAWVLANLYLASSGSDFIGNYTLGEVGITEGLKCFVSPRYLNTDVEDFVVHQAAHLLCKCKREMAGLRQTRTTVFLLNVATSKRELFASLCETYSLILKNAPTKTSRLKLATRKRGKPEFRRILLETAGARNGWKRILSNCSS